MKIIGGFMFVLGVLIFLVPMLTQYGTTDTALLGCLLMPGGILFGYLGSRPYRKQ